MRARRLKLKYKRLAQWYTIYGSLFTNKQPGRPRADFRYRNRVGRKAAKLVKVYQLLHYACMIYIIITIETSTRENCTTPLEDEVCNRPQKSI